MPTAPDPAIEAMIADARTDEHNARVKALLSYEADRSVSLNVEIRKRDARIVELEQELATMEAAR